MNVTFNVTATDARSFAASEAELSAMLLRAVKARDAGELGLGPVLHKRGFDPFTVGSSWT